MRATWGRTTAITVALALLGASVVDAGTPIIETTGTTTTEPTTTTTAVTTTTEPTTTTTAVTTTTGPPPAVADIPRAVTPERGTQVQVAPTLPPPPPTTTLPPELRLPPDSGSGRRVVYSKTEMRVWTVEADGRISKSHLVSGRRAWDGPLAGTYEVWSRSKYTCNLDKPYLCWMYMVRFAVGPAGGNIGFHEIPTDTTTGERLQTESQLGQALSGGCVRQTTSDAIYMWNWAPIGTKVVVLP